MSKAVDFKCNLCGNNKAKQIPFRYEFKGRYLWLYECNACKLRSIWPQPNSHEIAEMYAANYFTEADSATHHMNTDYLALLNSGNYADGVAYMQTYTTGGNILEIGCATGNFLYALKQAGYSVKGIELSDFAVQYAKEHFNISLINRPFDEELLGKEIFPKEFDVVVMGDVLEHFTNPTSAMRLVQTILKPGGVAIIHLPGTLNLISSKIAFLVYRLIGSQKTMHIPPYHLTEFNEKTIRKMCAVAGFSKVIVKHDIKHPNEIPLRGSWLENLIKKWLQYPNYFLTKRFGVAGDRITVEAYR
ncbi:MAG: class I SAM-dependent methyltransferase [Bacteroidia bacterium]|jgi:2-polyprenyl-3-methyl-5-hydroxy-6-metoxy-1,4-benzoquinol methylase|nr:class I SAM-dependent methyltransferase [Bacteroidia bacterium]